MQQFCPSLTLNTNTPCRHACLGAQSAAGPHPRHAPRPTPYAPHPTPPTPLQIHTLVNCQLVIPCWDRRVNLTNNLQTCLVCNNATHNIWSPWQAVYTWFICLNSSWLDAATVIYLLKKKKIEWHWIVPPFLARSLIEFEAKLMALALFYQFNELSECNFSAGFLFFNDLPEPRSQSLSRHGQQTLKAVAISKPITYPPWMSFRPFFCCDISW